MNCVELSAGPVEYEDSGGDGPTIVFLHGLLMDSSLWAGPIAELAGEHRCVALTLPLGAHRRPVSPTADLSLPGIAGIVTEFLDRLDLRDVTLVGNDTGGALVQVLARTSAPRVGRIVLASCEAFDNLPPGLTGRVLAATGALPPWAFGLVMQPLRLRAVRRLPLTFGWLTARGDDTVARWVRPVLTRAAIRRDAVRAIRAVMSDRGVLVDAAADLAAFDRPALVVWARGDRVMPPEHGRRLADLLPQSRFVEIDDSRTLLPLDQPERFAETLREFLIPDTDAPGSHR